MNIAYPIKKSEPTFRDNICPLYRNGKMHIVAKRRIMILSISVLVFNGINNADNPNIKKILNMFDPIIFPMVISDLSFRAAVIVTISSGKDVPTATTDNAI